MKRMLLPTMLLMLITSVFAQQTCEYNGIKTEFGYNYYEPGVKAEYADEQFVRMVDPKAVKTLEQLKGLTCLEHADFYNQGISGDLEELRDLVNLKVLSLHTNPEVYGDICTFSKATKLKSLKLAFDEQVYGDISCLKDLNLETFAMTHTQISGDLSDLSNTTNLKALYLGWTNVTGDVSALSGLTNLEELTLVDPAEDGSGFYGDLASLDNLKKLRKVALYNMNVTNCEHFHEVHPDIEGGCSDSSASTLIDPNEESEKIIGNGTYAPPDAQKYNKTKNDGGPPKECMVNNEFIGEDNCRALMDKTFKKQPTKMPTENCSVNGTAVKDTCGNQTNKTSSVQKEKTEPQEDAGQQEVVAEKNLLQQLIDWLISLFS